jgi:precorrin-6B methylase 1
MRLSWKYLMWREFGPRDMARINHISALALADARHGRSVELIQDENGHWVEKK